ncbi:ubiquitin-conjugating enzyme E2 [Novymonas esmeraldas]|uniref:Ubiquitin-conjugating enzyme E2 n=1 Tax=Novymonas esmeraldas TaxID=1808958 RepID=A0AAW0EVE6_9TRYP
MSAPTAQCLKRLQIELRKLNTEDELPFQIGADPHNMLRCYFVLDGPADTPYAGGRYVGLLEVPPDYPFKPPSVQLCTPSGRFKTGMQICLSNSSYHPENWSPMWRLHTILIALLSFFVSEEPTTGSMTATVEERRRLAAGTRQYNVERLQAVYKRALPAAFAADVAFLQKSSATAGDGSGSSSGSSGSDEEAEVAGGEREEEETGSTAAVTSTEASAAQQEAAAAVPAEADAARGGNTQTVAGAAEGGVSAVVGATAPAPHHRHRRQKTVPGGAVAERGAQPLWRRYISLVVLLAIGLGLLRQIV